MTSVLRLRAVVASCTSGEKVATGARAAGAAGSVSGGRGATIAAVYGYMPGAATYGSRPSALRPMSGAAGSPIGRSEDSSTAAGTDDDDEEEDDDEANAAVTPRSTAGDGVWRQRLSKPDLMACLYELSPPNEPDVPAAGAAVAAGTAGDFAVGGAARGDRNAVRFFWRNKAPLCKGSMMLTRALLAEFR